MKKIISILAFSLIGYIGFSQNYERQIFDYTQMTDSDSIYCSDEIFEKLYKVLDLIERLQSQKSAALAKDIFQKSDKCPQLYEVYAEAMFRSGEWMDAAAIIDSGIMVYGANYDLIYQRGLMNIEMAELGVGQKNIDGNSVYQSKNKDLDFNDSIFREQNYLAALSDFKYIYETYLETYYETYICGYVCQQLKRYDESTAYLSQLLDEEDYGDEMQLMIVDNYIGKKQYIKAETSLLNLEKKYPRNSVIQHQLTDLYEISGEKEKLEKSRLKADFYSWVPEYCNLIYSEENYETIQYFLDYNPSEEKLNKLKEISKLDNNIAIDIFITILNIHANHGNGVEEEVEVLLIEIGDSVVPKVILLMQNASSTCTVTKAASILAELKDPRAWQPMIDYLPRMENLPITIIAPSVPEQIIKFDRDKGLIVLLNWIRGQLEEDDSNSDDPFDELDNIFSSMSIYSPMSVYKKKELKKTAKAIGYTDKQIGKLIENVYGK